MKAEEEQEKAREAARADSEVALKVNGPAYTKVFHGREMELISFAIMYLPLGCRSLCLIFSFYRHTILYCPLMCCGSGNGAVGFAEEDIRDARMG